ncbi:low molecular weight phosphatase family protein [Actinosynnema sp. CS-041913]|uniref:arsenate-mycothiol transferase ArsC n=1 Tax=Actinosynnema sp. CS-041913 TaxID=3239917 RepID=UPI003D94C527
MTPTARRATERVVFVCARNSARSPLAVTLWSSRSHVSAASVGTRPAERVHPRTLDAARRHGMTLHTPATRHVDETCAGG